MEVRQTQHQRLDLVFQAEKNVAPGHWQLAFVKEVQVTNHPASSTGVQLF
jgi:hypothetical protein